MFEQELLLNCSNIVWIWNWDYWNVSSRITVFFSYDVQVHTAWCVRFVLYSTWESFTRDISVTMNGLSGKIYSYGVVIYSCTTRNSGVKHTFNEYIIWYTRIWYVVNRREKVLKICCQTTEATTGAGGATTLPKIFCGGGRLFWFWLCVCLCVCFFFFWGMGKGRSV